MDEQHVLLKTVVERLEKCNIPYMVAGSVAANSYMPVRTTNDIDKVKNIGTLRLKIILFECVTFYRQQQVCSSAFRLLKLEDKLKLGLRTLLSCNLIQTHIISKLMTYADTKSERQLSDLQNVIATQKEKLDIDYLRQWADLFGIRKDLEALL